MKTAVAKFIFISIVGVISLTPFQSLNAQFGAIGTVELPGALLTNVILQTAGIGIPGVGVYASGNAGAATCVPFITAVEVYDQKKTHSGWLTTLTFGLIGESGLEATEIQAEKEVVGAAKTCVDNYLKISGPIPGASLNDAVAKDTKFLEYSNLSTTYQTRLEAIDYRQNLTVKKLLQAIMLKILQNVEKDLTTRVVNGLVEKFKISNYLQYADALGGQVYAMDYINKNFEGDARQQMMVRQLVQSRLVGGQDGILVAKAFAQDKAEEFMGYDFQTDFTSPDFYQKLADLGSPNANPDYHAAVAEEQSATAFATGIANANLEISNGKGFLPPRDCSGSVSEQQQIDQRQLELGRKYLAAQQVYAKLVQATPKVKAADLAQAKEALDAVQAELRALPQEVSKPVVEICKAIENPAVADQINSFLTKHLSESSDFKPENLPFFATFISDVASNFITNIVTGGKGAGQLLKEAGLGALDSSFASDINTTTPAIPDSPTAGTIDPTNNTPGGTVNDTPGQTTPATCEQIKEALDQGVKLTCSSLPSARGQQFIIKVDFTGLLTQYDPKELNVSKQIILANGTPQSTNLEQGADIPSIISAPGIITYLVDDGIQGPTEFLFSITGTLKNSSTIFSRNARIKTTLPTGQVQGLMTRKIFFRSYGPLMPNTGPKPGIILR